MSGLAVLGTGRAGLASAAACLESSGFELVGMHTSSAARAGVPVAELLPGAPAAATVTGDLEELLARADVEAVVHAAAQPLEEAVEVLGRCAAAGKSVATLTGLVHPALELGEETAEALDRRAKEGGGRVVGAGLNPGFALDLLPIFLAGLAAAPGFLGATRVTDMRHWGDAALRHQGGVGGGDPELAQELSLLPSATVVGEALGDPEPELQEALEPLHTAIARSDGRRTVAAGEVVGFRRRVGGRAAGTDLELAWVGVFCADPVLDGVAPGIDVVVGAEGMLRCELRGEALEDPYPATAARALAAIGALRSMPPGLHRPDRLPLT